MNCIQEAIEVLKATSTNMKVNHMMKDMVEGVTSEEIKEYRENFNAIKTAIKILEKQLI